MMTYAELERLAMQQERAVLGVARAQAARDELLAGGTPSDPLLVIAEMHLARARVAEENARRDQQAALAMTVGQVEPEFPLLLLPIRLETRYDTGPGAAPRLRIRVYPDGLHRDGHEPALTPGELAAGKAYWQQRWDTSSRTDHLTAWKTLVTTVGALRATWVARELTPTNAPGSGQPPAFPSPATQAGRWMHSAQARLLPDRWVAHACRGGVRIASAEGGLIRRPLAAGPDPTDPTGALVDPGMLWMTDFKEAVRAGMGLVMDLPDRKRIDLLTVVGVRGTETPLEGSQALQELLVAQEVSAGLDLVPQGAPTNNTADQRSAYGAPDPTGSASFVEASQPPRGGDADRLAQALGIPLTLLNELAHGSQRGISLEQDMATVLWPGTWGYYLTQMLRLDEFDQAGPEWRRWMLDKVRAGGPLPVLRVGDQPYGLLPVTSLHAWRPALSPGLVIAELLRGQKHPAVRTAIRILGGLDSRGGWTFQPEQSFVLPAPDDASAVAIAAGDLDGDGLPELVVAHTSATESAAGSARFAVVRLEQEGLVVTGQLTLDASSGFPKEALSGLALAIGPLSSEGATGERPPNSVVAVLQFPRPGGGSRVFVFVGTGLMADGTVGAWARSTDMGKQFAPDERIHAAAMVPRSDGAVDLIVVTSTAGQAGNPPNPLVWRAALGLTPDGGITDGWSNPVPVGSTAGAGITRAGASVAVADLGHDGSLEGVLAQFWSHPDGTTSGSYAIGRDLMKGAFGSWPDFYNLGQSAARDADTLISAAATCVPWTPFRDSHPGLGTASHGVNLLEFLAGHWRGAVARVARVREGDPQPGRTLLDLLGADATSAAFDARSFVGTSVLDNVWFLLDEPTPTGLPAARAAMESLLNKLGLQASSTPRLGLGGFTDNTTPMTGPLVAPTEELGESPVPWLAEMARATATELHGRWVGAGVPLLARLIRHSLLQAYADAAFALVPVPNTLPPPLPEPELIDLADLTAPDPATPPHTLTSWRHLSEAVFQGQPVAEFIHHQARAATPPPEVQPLAELLRALANLAEVPSRDLERLASGVLDLATHRLDAWITAVATQRLEELRATSPAGIHTGGYGWVHDLEPATKAPSTGYIHAPSVLHAATAAVLRSGFLTHGGEQLAVDLSSTRVRSALTVLAAVRQGQSLGAALGYRFERELHDRGLAHFLEAFRQLAPQDVGVLTPAPEGTDVRATASLVTIDGLALLRMTEEGTLPWGSAPGGQPQGLPAIGSPDHAALVAALDGIRDAADAIADIGIAESVHQSIQRNPIRAAGTLDALSRGEVPPPEDPEVLRTPRTGIGVTHRILVAAPDPASPAASAALASWVATEKQRARHVRAVAEPRLNAWAAGVLGDPARVRFTVRYRDTATGTLVGDPVEVTLDKVGLCPMDVLAASSPGVANLTETNLGRRLLRYAATLAPVSASPTRVELVPERASDWASDILSLPEFLTIAESARNLVMGARAANRRDFVSGEAAPTAVDPAELGGRADGATTALTTALDALRAFFAIETDVQRATLAELFPGVAASLEQLDNLLELPLFCDISAASAALSHPPLTSLEDVRDALELLSGFGFRDAAPLPSAGEPAQERAALSVQSRAVVIAAAARLDAGAGADDARTRLEDLFGDGFRALPLFTPGLPSSMTAPIGADDDAGDEWFHGAARVREPAARLQELLLGSAVAGGAGSVWDIVQLPLTPGARWVALPVQPSSPPTRIPGGVVSIAMSTPDRDWRGSGPIAALSIDAWVEVVPSSEETTAVTFHLDTPGACAPQTALLALPPDKARHWTVDMLADLIAETSALAALRAVDPDLVPAVGHLLPALLFAHNVGGDPAGDTVSTTTGA
ncbi:FG-GAP repeat domain-containing protein [Corallococcus exiguus]|uniref:FG-GAP repeat domain-containing protein n=1 Tax=Corallococcus exiguus TaxID=83462 RepID=UPI0015613F0E|nr:VCBS repeat-containing protein [Corallococcus exiguus]NRD43905.1 VCBS repeat-containing protein [Corallococcus exiguus]